MSQRVAVIALGAVLTGLLVGVVIASSGGDGGSKSTDTAPPDLTVPGSSGGTLTDTKTDKTKTDSGTTGDSGTNSGGTDQSGGAQAPSSTPDTGGAAPAQPQDTPQNDTQPPADSPAQKFEQFCNDNPSAC